MRLIFILRGLVPFFFAAFSAYGSQIIYVNQNATGSSQNGASWSTAYHELRDALPGARNNASVNNPVEIWVAAGNYKPTADTVRTKSFALPGYVTIRGGFTGTESNPNQRTATGHWTILSGDIGVNDQYGITSANIGGMLGGTIPIPSLDSAALAAGFDDNSYNVITCEGVNNVVLDGLVITGGNANNTDSSGASVRTLGDIASMTTVDFGSDSNPNLTGSPLILPDPVVSGGGLFVTNYYSRPASQTTLTLINCVFIHNAATQMGGAIAAYEANLSLTGCSFLDNYAQQQGGAYGGLNQFASFQSCLFSNNAAYYYGGAVYLSTMPSTKTIPSALAIQQAKAVQQTVGASLKVVYSIGKLVFSKTSDEAGPFAGFDFESFIDDDPENAGLSAAADAEASAVGIGDVYAVVGIAMGIGSLAGDMAIALGADPNSSAYQGWLKTSTFFNTYLSPVGILTIISDATGGSLGALTHQSSFEDQENAYMQSQLNNFNVAPYTTIKDCTFQGNSAQGEGGAAVALYDNVQFDRCWFMTNSAVTTAGALGLIGWNTPRVFNCAFSGNRSTEGYSAIFNSFHARSQIINDTLVGNNSSASGGAGACVGSELGSAVKVFNSVLWNNTDTGNPNGGADLFVATSANITGNILDAYNDAGPGQSDFVATLDLRASTVQSFNSLPHGTEDFEIYPWNADSFLISISEQYFQQADMNGFADLAGYVNLGEGIRSGSFQVIQGQNYWLNNATDPQFTGQGGVIPLYNSPVRAKAGESLWGFSASFSGPLPIFSAGSIYNSGSLNGYFSGPNTFAARSTVPIYDVFTKGRDAGGMDRGCVQYQGSLQQGLQNTILYVKKGAPAGGNGKSWATAYSDLSAVLAGNGQFPGGLQIWLAQGIYTDSGLLPPGVLIYGGFNGTETSLSQRNWNNNPTVYTGNMFCAGDVLLDGLIVTNYHSANYPAISSQGSGSAATINNCYFANNSGAYAGAVYWRGQLTASNSQFYANSCTVGEGGAVDASEGTFINCWFQNNSSGYGGGAVWVSDYVKAYNCVFTGNTAPQGSAIMANNGGAGAWYLYNDTFFGNGAMAIVISGSYSPSSPVMGVFGPAPVPVNCAFWGNISDGVPSGLANPLFLNPPGGNFQLSPNSPAIGAGSTNSLPSDFPTTDLAGNPRIVNGRIDLGAFEFQNSTGYQTQVALSGTNQIFSVLLGSNPTPTSLQWQVNTGNGVWVNLANDATYQGVNTLQLTVPSSLSLFGNQYRLVGVVNGSPVTMMPGGLVNTAPSGIFYVRQGATGSGDGSSWQNAFPSIQSLLGNGYNSPTVVWVAKGTYSGSGQANANIQFYGGFAGTETDLSQRNPANNPTIFTQGYIQCAGNLIFDGFIVTNCQSVFGAIFSQPGLVGGANPTATINNCTFINNSNYYNGVVNWYGMATVSNCQFIANQTIETGGGISANEITAINCYFATNYAGFEGGAICAQDYALVMNCAFIGNTSPNGSAIFMNIPGANGWNLYNDTFYGNGPFSVKSSYPPGLYGTGPNNPVNCLFWQNVTDNVPTQVFPNLSSDPMFTNPVAGNLKLSAYSPAIGAATTNGLPANFPTVDVAGNPRFVNGRLDLGAYEFTGTPVPPPNSITTTVSPAYLINGLYGPYFNFSTILGTNATPTSLQWQVNAGNGVWVNVTNGPVYQGANTLQLVAYNANNTLASYQYQLTGTAANGAYFKLAPVTLPASSLTTSFGATETVGGGFAQNGQWGPVYTVATALGTAAAGASLQWQVNMGNGIWLNVTNGSIYQGAAGQQLLIINPSAALNGYQYRLTGSSTNGAFVLMPVTIATSFPRTLYVDGTHGYNYYTNWVAVHGSAPVYDGLTWATAFPTLHEALTAAQPGAEIWVRSGTYYPLRTLGVDGYPLPAKLALARSVRLLGGFAGTETNVVQRNWQTRPTVINCSSNAPGDDPNLTFYHYAASPSAFVNGSTIGNDSILDGFTLSGATAGAVVNQGGSPTLQNCTFVNNFAVQGAAMSSWSNASPVLANCILSTNQAQQGTLYFNNATGLVENCLLSWNNSFLNGTVYGTNATVSLLNCTMAFNAAPAGNSAGLANDGGSAAIVNSIFWANAGAQVGGTGSTAISYSCVQGGGTTNNNFAFDPIFMLPASNNFQLTARSPLLNVGNAAAVAGLSVDLNNQARVLNTHVDMGPFEYQGTPGVPLAIVSLPYTMMVTNFGVYNLVANGLPATFTNVQWQINAGGAYVPVTNNTLLNYDSTLANNSAALTFYLTNQSKSYNVLDGSLYRFVASGLNFTSPPALVNVQIPLILFVNSAAVNPVHDGLTWATAFTNLTQALTAPLQNVGEIWIAKGTYALPTATNTVKVKLYGGFAGNETDRSARNWNNNITVLTATGCSVSGGIDGCTIQGSAGIQNGITIGFASPTIQNCVLSGGNTQVAVNVGSPVFASCIFSNATAAITVASGTASLTNCAFMNLSNVVTVAGASAAAVISDCVFTGNSGSSVQDMLGGNVTVKDSLFTGNSGNAIVHNGAQGGAMSVINCTLANNQQPKGAITAAGVSDTAGLQVRNCILWNNVSTGWQTYLAANPAIFTSAVVNLFSNADVNEIYTTNGFNAAVASAQAFAAANAGQTAQAATYQNKVQQYLAQSSAVLSAVGNNCIQGLAFFSGNNNLGADPLFVDPLAGNFSPDDYSSALNTGNSNFASTGELDLAGNPRLFGSAVDLGAYEVQSAPLGILGLSQNPQSLMVTVPGYASFSATIAANSSFTDYVWQMNTGSGWTTVTPNTVFSINNTGNTTTLSINPVDVTMNGAQFRLAALPINYASAPATLNIALTPLAASLNQGTTTRAVLPQGVDAANYVWQFNSGSGWVTITNGGVYAIVNSNNVSTLTILAAFPALNGQYRLVASDGSFTSVTTSLATMVPPVLYINAAAAGNRAGTNWANAIVDLGTALAIVQPGEQIWVAAGTYQAINNSGNAVTWPLSPGMPVYGGFAGNETSLAQRNWNTNACVLMAGTNNSILAVQPSSNQSAGRLDGFILTGGNGQPALVDAGVPAAILNCTFSNNLAGASALTNATVTFSNCLFIANSTTNGGALTFNGGAGNLWWCRFLTNTAQSDGGAIYGQTVSLLATNCTFAGNMAGGNGGAINLQGANAYIDLALSSLSGNTANNGGAIYFYYGASDGAFTSRLYDDLIVSNHSHGQGGGICWNETYYGGLLVMCSTVANNTAAGQGGGIYAHTQNNSGANLFNSIFWGNQDQAGDSVEFQQIYDQGFLDDLAILLQDAQQGFNGLDVPVALQYKDNVIEGLALYNQPSGVNYHLVENYGNFALDPQFINPTAGNFQLQPTSPAINVGDNIQTGNISNMGFGISLVSDLAGNPRIYNNTVDLGAYEVQNDQAPPFQSAVLPVSQAVCDNGSIVTFKLATAGPFNLTNAVWQINPGSGFQDLGLSSNFNVTITSNGSALTIQSATLAMDGYQFRLRVAGYAYTTPPATLSVASEHVFYVNAVATGNGSGTNWANAFTNLQSALTGSDCAQIWVAQGTYTIPVGTNGATSFRLRQFLDLRGGFAGTETNVNQRDYAQYPTILSAAGGQSIFLNDGTAALIDQTAILDGFILTGATVNPAIFNIDASPTVRNCVFTNNLARAFEDWGITNGANGVIVNCQFINNPGGGILNKTSAPFITNCVFRGNATTAFGGGVDNEQGNPTIVGCLFENNTANLGGGFYNNSTNTGIGLVRDIFRGNTASQGGAIYDTAGSSLALRDSLLVKNNASIQAGAVFDSGSVTAVNTTIADNTAGYAGGGIWVDSGAGLSVINSIIWGNTVTTPGIAQVSAQIGSGTPASPELILNSILEGSSSGPFGVSAFDPLFINEPAGDYHLTGASPAINSGNAGNVLGGELDLDGNVRQAGTGVDLGAYEFQGVPSVVAQISSMPQSVTACASNNILLTVASPVTNGYSYIWQQQSGADFTNLVSNVTYAISAANGIGVLAISNIESGLSGSGYRVLVQNGSETVTSSVVTVTVNPRSVVYVNAAAAPGGDGSSWSHAFVNLADAVAQGNCSDIWIAGGTYTPTNPVNGQPMTIQLLEGMRLFGGFTGTETNLAQRDPVVNHAILTAKSGTTALKALNSGGLVDQSTLVDGLFITGISNTPAILLSGAGPLFRNCIFAANNAAAVSCQGGAAPAFVNCSFSNNIGSSAVLAQNAAPMFTGCVFANNQTLAGQSGGVINAGSGSILSFWQCTFTNNTAAGTGGAMFLDQSTATVVSSLLANNSAAMAGAIGTTNRTTLYLLNDTIAQNSAPTVGGIFIGSQAITGQGYLTNCILWNNGSTESSQLTGNASVAYSCIQGLSQFAGNNNVPYDPLFVNAVGGVFTLQDGSPCVDTGDDAAVATSFDLVGAARIQGYSVDMGADESAGVGQYIQVTQQPQSQTGCEGGVVKFTVAGPANFGSNFVWQINTGSGFVPLVISGNYSAVTNNNSSTLTLNNADVSFSGYQYRAAIGDLGLYSSVATLTVLQRGVLYVNTTATGTGSGVDWADAATSLDAALAAADPCTEVWVAKGTYISTNLTVGPGFKLNTGAAVYGGFAGNETNRLQRDWTNNLTQLVGGGQTNIVEIRSSGMLDGFSLTGTNTGSGIYIGSSVAAALQNCTFISNSAPAVVNAGSTVGIQGCAFVSNSTVAMINNGGGSLTVTNCIFNANQGGAILNQASSLVVKQSLFRNNTAVLGGAVSVTGNSPLVWFDHCIFATNTATAEGGAIYNGAGGNLSLVNNLFYGNTAQNGGAVADYAQSIILSSTFSGNGANVAGGGYYGPQAVERMTNSIFWNNTAGTVSAGTATVQVLGTGTIYNCIIQGGSGPGNSPAFDPQFVNPLAGDFHLTSYSPAIGVGYLPAVTNIATDLDGRSRVAAWGLDLGAYESGNSPQSTVAVVTLPVSEAACAGQVTTTFTYTSATNVSYIWQLNATGWQILYNGQQGPAGEWYFIQTITNGNLVTSTLTISNVVSAMNGFKYAIRDLPYLFNSTPATLTVTEPSVIYVNAAAAPGGNGMSWATAFADLPSAFNAVDPCQSVIWVAAGTYSPSTNDPVATFQVPSVHGGLKIYGGFAGTETSLTQRDWNAHPTILAGSVTNLAVISVNGVIGTIDTNTLLDGFSISGGSSGLSVLQAGPTIANCVIASNSIAGVSVIDGSPFFEHDQFLVNAGPGLTITTNFATSAPRVEACVFQGNAGTIAGAIYAYGATPIVINTLVSGNAGTAIVFSNSPATVVNVTVAGNGYGLAAGGAAVNIANSIFWGNGSSITNLEGDQISGNVTVANSCVQGLNLYTGNGNAGFDPLFLNSLQPAVTLAGDYHLHASSPAIASGNPSVDAVIGAGVDVDGNSRIVNGMVDMGAYEFTGTVVAPLTISLAPTATAYLGNAMRLTATVTGSGLMYQWQGDFGQGWVNLNNGSDYAGVNDVTLVILNPNLLLNGIKYRVIVGDVTGASTVSSSVTVSVLSSIWYVNAAAATNGDGRSWATACTDISSALAVLAPGLTNRQVWVAAGSYQASVSDPSAVISVPENVTLLGGFTGNETNVSQRDWVANPTIFEGLLSDDNAVFTLLSVAEVTNVTVDGFQFQNGNLCIDDTNSDLSLVNCAFINNVQAIVANGGNLSLVASLFATNNAVGDNLIGIMGAGASIQSCTFDSNPGEVITTYGSTVVISNCLFANNPDTGLYNGSGGTVMVQDTLFVNNGIGSFSDYQSFPSFTNCSFAGNTCGLLMNSVYGYSYLTNFNSTIVNVPAFANVDHCLFLTNTDCALKSQGAYTFVSRSEFRGNTTMGFGAGLNVTGGYLIAIGSLFSGNYATGGGGAIYVTGSSSGGSLSLNNCTVVANGSAGVGAGIRSDEDYYGVTIQNSILWDNYGPDAGGNYGNSASAQFYGVESFFFYGNQNDLQNYPYSGDPASTTINPAFLLPAPGGGANAPTVAGDYHLGGSSPVVGQGLVQYIIPSYNFGPAINTDLDGNPRQNNGAVDLGAYEFQGTASSVPLTVSASTNAIVYYPEVPSHNVFNVTASGANLTYQWYADFNDGRGFVVLTDNAYFSGTTSATLSFTGLPLSLSGLKLMVLVSSGDGGAIFTKPVTLAVNPTQWYVNPSAPPGGNGLTWATAFNDLNTALLNPNLTPGGSQIWVAQGNYTANAGYWVLPNYVALVGGFAGYETDPNQRDIKVHPTILNNQIDVGDGALLDGFTVDNSQAFAYASGIYVTSYYNTTNAPSFANCTVYNASSGTGLVSGGNNNTNVLVITNCQFYGGNASIQVNGQFAMYDCTCSNYYTYGVNFLQTTPATNTLVNCAFDGSASYGYAIAVMDQLGTPGSAVDINNCQLVNNGYGISCFGVYQMIISNSVIANNVSAGININNFADTNGLLFLDHCLLSSNGPAITTYGGNVHIKESLIAGNSGIYRAGALNFTTGNALVENSTIAGNFSGPDAGAIDGDSASPLVLNNSIVWGNVSTNSVIIAGSVSGSNNCIQAFPAGFASGANNLSIDPKFIAPVTASATPTTNGNYHLMASSPLRAAGNPALTRDTTDLDGNPRLADGLLDMGAYQTGLTYSFTHLQPMPGVGFQINISGTLSSYSVLWSSNLVNWQVYGTFTAQGNGNFRFTDTNALNRPAGYYRVHSP